MPRYGRRLALAGDGRRLAVGGWKGNVDLWDLEARHSFTNFVVGNSSILQLQFSRSGDQLLCLGQDAGGKQVLQLYETSSWGALDLAGIRLDELHRAVLSPSGRMLAVAHRSGIVRWWDLKTKRLQAQFPWEHLGPEVEIAFSPDGRWFAAGGEQSVLMLLEVAHQRTMHTTHVHRRIINALAFSPDESG